MFLSALCIIFAIAITLFLAGLALLGGIRGALLALALTMAGFLFLGSHAKADEIPCTPLAEAIENARNVKADFLLIDHEGINLAAVVTAYLRNAGVPEADTAADYVMFLDRDGGVTLRPILASQMCPKPSMKLPARSADALIGQLRIADMRSRA